MLANNCPLLSIAAGVMLLLTPASAAVANGYPLRAQGPQRDARVRSDPAFAAVMLRSHNNERARWRLPSLSWNPALARDAQIWADYLARTNRFDHDYKSDASSRQGENLWMGTRNAWTYAEMVEGWTIERKLYRSGVFPAVSRSRNWEDVGHYTQLIWRDTRQMGCAVAHNRDNDYLVCRYDPPGNIAGQVAEQGRRIRAAAPSRVASSP